MVDLPPPPPQPAIVEPDKSNKFGHEGPYQRHQNYICQGSNSCTVGEARGGRIPYGCAEDQELAFDNFNQALPFQNFNQFSNFNDFSNFNQFSNFNDFSNFNNF